MCLTVFETVSGSCLPYLQISPQQCFFVVHDRLRVFFQHRLIRRVNTVKKFTLGVNYILHGMIIQYAVKFFHSGGNKGYLSINALSTIHNSTAYTPVDNAISATFQIKKHMLFFFQKQGSAAHCLHLTKNKSF